VSDASGRRRGLVISAVAALVVAAIYVLLRQRSVPDLLVQSDEGWQPEVRAAIGGEVINPGAYTLRGDARLSDLVVAAGGYTEQAERTALNPAARVSDGMECVLDLRQYRVGSRRHIASCCHIPPGIKAWRDARIRAHQYQYRDQRGIGGAPCDRPGDCPTDH